MAKITHVSSDFDFELNKLHADIEYENGMFQNLTFDIPPLKTALVGMSTDPTITAQMVKDFPGIKYMRDYGLNKGQILSPMNSGKFLTAPKDCIMHVSWKGDVEQLSPWLDNLTRPVYITWYHEPMGDVAPATYRTKGERVANIIKTHKNRHLVLGNGPNVTRYWLDEGNNPDDWAYNGMTFYAVDAYSRDTVSYWSALKMFACFDKLKKYGVEILVPEWGMLRTTVDKTGEGRAKAILDQGYYLMRHPLVKAFAYWNNWDDYKFLVYDPEAATYKMLLT